MTHVYVCLHFEVTGLRLRYRTFRHVFNFLLTFQEEIKKKLICILWKIDKCMSAVAIFTAVATVDS